MKISNSLKISFISLSLISIELSWTRIFSAEFYYTFAFLILSTAILGLGLGSLSVRLFRKFNSVQAFYNSLILTGISSILGPILVFKINPDFSRLYTDILMTFKFLITIILLSLPFYFGGISISLILKKNYKDIPKLYMADLLGAGIGVLAGLVLMNAFGTPVVAILNSLPILFISLFESNSKQKILSASIIACSIMISLYAPSLLETERKDRGKILFTHWDAMSKIRVVEYNEVTRGIRIDNAAQTSVYKFNGDFKNTQFRFDINVSNLIHKFDSCVFLSLGAGGGVDVLHALQEGASEIHAVEVIPYINHLLENGELADYTGNIYKNQKVKVITEDARTYVRRFNNKFDIIFALSSNSYAALASGAFALAENYLFTTEAFSDYWDALSDNGFLIIEHHFYVPRMVSEVMTALKEKGIDNPQNYFAVYNLPHLHRNILLLSKRRLDENTINLAFGITLPIYENYTYPLFPAADSNNYNLINQIVLNGWENLQQDVPFDISPCTDDKPFIAQMGMWKNLDFTGKEKIAAFEWSGFPLSKLNILVIIGIIILIIMPLNLLPIKYSKKKLKAVPWLYFFFIGMGFMMLEVILIQMFTLFIGSSIYSIITVLFIMLISSGIGSKYSNNFDNKVVFGAIVFWIALDILLLTPMTYMFGGLELIPRILISILFICPLGFFMGMPFPKAGIKVGELIDWGFAVNGAASVLGSTIIILIAISYGFQVSLIIGGLCYLLAFYLIQQKNKW